jgi:hypothetical protein
MVGCFGMAAGQTKRSLGSSANEKTGNTKYNNGAYNVGVVVMDHSSIEAVTDATRNFSGILRINHFLVISKRNRT